MPGPIPEVVAKVGGDASGYITAYRGARAETQGLIGDHKELQRTIAETQNAIKSLGGGPAIGGAGDVGKINAGLRETLALLGQHQPAVAAAQAATAGFGAVHTEVAGMVRDATAAIDDQRSSLAALAGGHRDASGAAAALMESQLRSAIVNRESTASIISQAEALSALRGRAKEATDTLADTAVAVGAVRSAAGGSGGGAAPLSAAVEALISAARPQPTIPASELAALTAGAAASPWRSGGGGGGFAAAPAGGGGGGDNSAFWNWFSGSGHGGGGGGGRGDSYGAFTPWRGGGFQAIRFWTSMTAEIGATAIPAIVAAGAAGAVGLQAIQEMVPRYKAIAAASGSIGSALGVSTGSFLGLPGALGKAQTADRGGVYGLLGAGISYLQAGSGGFAAEGTQTLAMLDRAAAQVDIDKGGKTSGLLSGGTQDLREYGDVLSNLVDLVGHIGPNLPGVGGDLLATLSGATGVLSRVTGLPGAGAALGGLLTYEAGTRWGPALTSGEGLIGRALGLKKVGGIAGILGKIPGLGSVAGVDEAGEAIAGTGLAGFVGGIGAPELGAAALAAYLGDKLYTSMPGSAQRQVGAMQAGINASGFSAAWQPLAKAVTKATGLAQSAAQSKASIEGIGATETTGELGRFGPMGETTAQIYQQGAQSFSRQMGELAGAGPQLQAALKKAGLKGVDLADALQIGQNALLDMSHAFGKDGKLTQDAQQVVTNYARVIGPMTQSGGAFGAAIGASTIMSSSKMQNLAQVNQGLDSYMQVITGGANGMSTLFGMLGGAPVSKGPTRAGIQLSAPPAYASMAKALESYTTAGGAAAWQTFAGSQGLVAAEQQNLDQLRTSLTLGAINQPGAAGLAGFQLEQMLPLASKSKGALATLMSQGAQMGVTGYYDPSQSLAQNYKDAEKSIGKIADSTKQANAATDNMTMKLANIPQVAQQFAQNTKAAVQSQEVAKAATDAMNIKGGINIKANTADLISQLKAAGVQGGAALKSSLDAILAQAGVGKAERIKIEAEVTGTAQVKTLQQMLNGLHDRHVTATAYADAHPVQVLSAAMSGLTNRTVTVTTRMVTEYINTVKSVFPNIPSSAAVGVAPGFLLSHGQHGGLVSSSGIARYAPGGLVPGVGSGDHVPALLEPGEAIVPRFLVPLVAPILKSHHVPGFAAGGIVPAGTLSGVDSQISAAWTTLDALYKKEDSATGSMLASLKQQVSNFWSTVLDPLYKAKDAFGSVSKDATKTAASTKAASTEATKLANSFTTAMNYARGVSGAAMAGQGFGTTGLISGMDPTQDTVGNQMQTYLTSVKSFAADLKTLTKGGLSKDILKQLIAAGPTQGDALAQSILGGGGTSGAGAGISQVNALWKQIGTASHALGAQAAMSAYGQHLSPTLQSGQITNVNINVNASAGAGGNLNLTTAQISEITAKVQAALLKQAKRNRVTGVALRGKSA